MTIKTYLNLAITLIGTNIILLLGGWDKLLSTLVILVVIDYITGMAKGYKNKTLNSYIGFKGISKKICLFLIIVISNQFDGMLVGSEHILRTASIMFYISNEGLSILENMSELGVPIPEEFKKRLLNFKK